MLERDLDWVELNGLPAWTERGEYRLPDKLPSEKRFTPGDVFVWSSRGPRYLVIARLVAADLVGRILKFQGCERLQRPVLLQDAGVDRTAELFDGKGFFNEFSYVTEATFQRIVSEASRPAAE